MRIKLELGNHSLCKSLQTTPHQITSDDIYNHLNSKHSNKQNRKASQTQNWIHNQFGWFHNL